MQRTCYDRLHRIFTEGFRGLDLAEALPMLEAGADAAEAGAAMQERGERFAAVVEGGEISGYVERETLTSGAVRDHRTSFDDVPLLQDTAPLGEAIRGLADHDAVFVELLGRPSGVITRDDVEKAPVRMWLFGSITLIEMALTRAIRRYYPGDRWMPVLPEARLQKALELWKERQRRSQNVELLDCTQMGDKVVVLLKDDRIREELGFQSRRRATRVFQGLQSLRNDLAHTQAIVRYGWDSILLIAEHLDRILDLVREDP